MSEIDTELDKLRHERNSRDVAVRGQQSHYADMLRNGMGQDMKDVLSGKIQIKVVRKNWFKRFLERLWNLL